jgi:hypothetical protein
MAQDNVTIVRETDQRRREVNLRPFLLALDGCCTRPGEVELRVTLAFGSGGSARPREVVDALGALVPGLAIRRAHRVRLLRHELKHNGQYPSVEGGEIDFDQRNTD